MGTPGISSPVKARLAGRVSLQLHAVASRCHPAQLENRFMARRKQQSPPSSDFPLWPPPSGKVNLHVCAPELWDRSHSFLDLTTETYSQISQALQDALEKQRREWEKMHPDAPLDDESRAILAALVLHGGSVKLNDLAVLADKELRRLADKLDDLAGLADKERPRRPQPLSRPTVSRRLAEVLIPRGLAARGENGRNAFATPAGHEEADRLGL
jgi:hypothetical protein